MLGGGCPPRPPGLSANEFCFYWSKLVLSRCIFMKDYTKKAPFRSFFPNSATSWPHLGPFSPILLLLDPILLLIGGAHGTIWHLSTLRLYEQVAVINPTFTTNPTLWDFPLKDDNVASMLLMIVCAIWSPMHLLNPQNHFTISMYLTTHWSQ